MKVMLNSFYLKFGILSLLLISVFSCRKSVYNEIDSSQNLSEQKFFDTSAVPPEVQDVAEFLKNCEGFKENLPAFIKKNGTPVWNKTFYSTKTETQGFGKGNKASSSDDADKAVFFVPLKSETTNDIKSYITAYQHDDSHFTYRLYNVDTLNAIKPKNEVEKQDLLNTYAVLGYFEKTINNKDSLDINNSGIGKTRIKNTSLQFTSGNSSNAQKKSGNKVLNATVCDVLDIYIEISYTLIHLETEGYSLWYQSYSLTLVIELDCYEAGGGTYGSNSGGSSNPSNPNPSGDPWGGYFDPWNGDGWNGDYNDGIRYINDPNPNGVYPWYNYPQHGGSGGSTTNPPPNPPPSDPPIALTDEDMMMLDELNQEDNEADQAITNINPCHGTARIGGNLQWYGTLEHWMIQLEYMVEHPGSYREYYIPGSGSGVSGSGYADIVNPMTKEIFEIKSESQLIQGTTEVENYINIANQVCPPESGQWLKGTGYNTKHIPYPNNPIRFITANLSAFGVITYKPSDNTTIPQLLPQDVRDQIKNLIRKLVAGSQNADKVIMDYLKRNPGMVTAIKAVAVGIVVGTIVEDILTGGFGIADDWASFALARNIWRIAAKM